METIAVSELRANLMRVLQRVEKGGRITITARGREVACLVPPEDSMEKARKSLKELRKTALIGDVVSPLGEE